MAAAARTSGSGSRGLSAGVIALLCGVIAVLAGLAAVLASQDGWSPPSALVKMSRSEPLAPLARATDPGFVLVNPQEHYDGVYYYAIARDPFLRGEEHELIDLNAYRYGHPMHGWLAAVVSLGQDRWVPTALLLLSLAGLGTGAWAISRLSVALDRTPWGGLLVATSPGLLYSATISTTEAVGVALAALSVLAWVRRRYGLALPLLVMLCLTKEQYVTVPAGLALWELVEARRRGGWPRPFLRMAVVLAAGPAVLAGWYVYVHAVLGRWPSSYEDGNLGPPVVGWLETFERGLVLSQGTSAETQMGAIAAPVLIAVAVTLLLAAASSLRLRTPLDGILLGMVAITSCMGYLTLLYPHELVRNPAVVLLLAIAVLLTRPSRRHALERSA